MNTKIEKPMNLVSLLSNHIDEHPLLFLQNHSFSSRNAQDQTNSLVFSNHLNLCDFHVGYNYKFVDPKNLRSIHGQPQTFTKRRSRQKLSSISKILSFRNSIEAKTCGGKSKTSTKSGETTSKTLKLVPLSHFNGSHQFP